MPLASESARETVLTDTPAAFAIAIWFAFDLLDRVKNSTLLNSAIIKDSSDKSSLCPLLSTPVRPFPIAIGRGRLSNLHKIEICAIDNANCACRIVGVAGTWSLRCDPGRAALLPREIGRRDR